VDVHGNDGKQDDISEEIYFVGIEGIFASRGTHFFYTDGLIS